MKIITDLDVAREGVRRLCNDIVAGSFYMQEKQAAIIAFRGKDIDSMSLDEINALLPKVFRDRTAVLGCNECKGDFSEVVEVGDEPDYESSTARLCRDCVGKALALFPTR